tara:strand:- start:19444 stop:19761 length:318 start_codon:yes stop_codon:yes gene_type:complete
VNKFKVFIICIIVFYSKYEYNVSMIKARTIKELGNLLRLIRTNEGLTQSELAKKIGLKQVSISRLENGESVSLKTLEKVMIGMKLELSLTKIPKIDTTDLSSLLE